MQINGKNLEVLRVALERALADVHTDRQHANPAGQWDLVEERIVYQNMLIRVRAAIEKESK
jgi:hypothetical protein